jgi:Acyl-CoA reductase (LuxC)
MTALAHIPVRKIIAAISHAAERWSDADFPPRVRAIDRIAARTGYSVPVVEYALDRLFFSITRNALEAAIAGELGSIDALDGFASRDGRPEAFASPAGTVCIISSRTTIGVAIVPAIFALCAKCEVLVKDREDSLVASFFEALSEELDAFHAAARAAVWTSGDERAADMRGFDVVVAFGSDDTLATIHTALSDATSFIGFGSRASAGYVTRESLGSENLAREIARGAARDLVLYETEGCLSLHVLFAERGAAVSLREFGSIMASEIGEANIEFPIGERSAADVAAIAQRRNLAAFRSAGGRGCVYAGASGEYAVIVDHPADEPPHFLPRTIGIVGVDEPQQALAYLREHRLPLEGFALSSDRADVVTAAIESGAVRLTRFGELQNPPLAGHHGGRPRIAEFVRWIDKTL